MLDHQSCSRIVEGEQSVEGIPARRGYRTMSGERVAAAREDAAEGRLFDKLSTVERNDSPVVDPQLTDAR